MISFFNKYDPDSNEISVGIGEINVLTGRDLIRWIYFHSSFKRSKFNANCNWIYHKGDGNFDFGIIVYETPGAYEWEVKEKIVSLYGVYIMIPSINL